MRHLVLIAPLVFLGSARAQQPVADDAAMLTQLLGAVRGASPLFCELAIRSVDGRTWWGGSGAGPGGALEVDSASAAVIRWVHERKRDGRIVPRLTSVMRDPDACVRRVAGSLLGHIEHPAASAALLAALDDESSDTRSVAALGLGMAETRTAVQPLVRRLRDASPSVRRSAAWALGEIEDKAAMLPLIELLERDGDARVRQAAAEAIGKVIG